MAAALRFIALAASVARLAAAPALGACDILGAAGFPCVAAHSTVRALYAAYAGALYNVTRASDNATFSVPVLAPGGYADKAAHDAFCPALDCVISHVLDQSPMCVTCLLLLLHTPALITPTPGPRDPSTTGATTSASATSSSTRPSTRSRSRAASPSTACTFRPGSATT